QRRRVDGLPLADGHRPGGLVVVPAGDDALGIGHDRAVVEEHVDVVLGGQQRADVALQHEVRLPGALDGLLDLRVGGVHQVAYLPADVTLPVGQRVDVGVDPWILGIAHLPKVPTGNGILDACTPCKGYPRPRSLVGTWVRTPRRSRRSVRRRCRPRSPARCWYPCPAPRSA